jgi:hypothetical protein
LVFIGLHIIFYGTSGLNAGIQTLVVYWKSPYNYTIASTLLQYILIGWIAAIQHGFVVLFISALSRNAFVAFVPSLIAYIIPVISYVEISPVFHTIMRLFPVNTIGSMESLFGMADFYTVFGLLIDRKALATILAILMIIVFAFSIFRAFRHREPSN